VAHHGETHFARLELFGLFELLLGRPPPPLLMHIGPVGRIHQPDDRMVYMRIEIHGLDNDRPASNHARQHRRLAIRIGRPARIGRHVDPNDALLLAHRIAAHAELGDVHCLVAGQGRDVGTGARRVELPAVIRTLHHAGPVLAQHFARRQGSRTVRTDVAQTIRLAIEVAPQQDRLTQEDIALQGAGFQVGRQSREPPAVAQESFAERDTGGHGR
jgi:hypothetical protein